MNSKIKFIFDLDGTLYRYRDNASFAASRFYADIKQNIFCFLEKDIGLDPVLVPEIYRKLKMSWHGHVSMGVEKEYGVDRNLFFKKTWSVAPDKYIERTDEPRRVLESLQGRIAILTEAPRVWAEPALAYLGVYDLVQSALFTGEPDVRKPSREAFVEAAHFLAVPFNRIYSVGDQEESDIVPAHALGMHTIRMGSGPTIADHQIDRLDRILDMDF